MLLLTSNHDHQTSLSQSMNEEKQQTENEKRADGAGDQAQTEILGGEPEVWTVAVGQVQIAAGGVMDVVAIERPGAHQFVQRKELVVVRKLTRVLIAGIAGQAVAQIVVVDGAAVDAVLSAGMSNRLIAQRTRRVFIAWR